MCEVGLARKRVLRTPALTPLPFDFARPPCSSSIAALAPPTVSKYGIAGVQTLQTTLLSQEQVPAERRALLHFLLYLVAIEMQ